MTLGERAFAALFVLAVAAALLGDRFFPDAPVAAARALPVEPTAGAAWCPLPSAEEASSFVETANLGTAAAKLRRVGVGQGGVSTPATAGLAPGALSSLEGGALEIKEAIGIVESFGSPTASHSLVLARGAGVASAPCSGQPGTRWLFAGGSTARGQDTYLLIANPFQEMASVGIRVLTKDGPVPLPRLRDYTVQPLTEAVIFLSDFHPQDASFGIDVSVSRGRLIVSRFTHVAPRSGAEGLSLALGARRAATRWQFAQGEVPGEGEETIALANPGEREALVQVVFQTEGEQVAAQELEEVPVPPGSQVAINVSDRLPRGTKHGTTVLVTNRAPIVAERLTAAASGGLRGTESTLGTSARGRTWLVPAGSPSGGSEQLALVNTGRMDATASIALLTLQGEVRPPDLAQVPVAAGRRASVDLTPFLGGQAAAAIVEASADGVFAEGRLFLADPYGDFADAPGRLLP